MVVSEIISKHYVELFKAIPNKDTIVSMDRDGQDLFHDCLITALRKFKDSNITEDEGLEYIKKTIGAEIFFNPKRLKNEKIIYMESTPDISDEQVSEGRKYY